MKVDNGTLNFRVYEDAVVFYGIGRSDYTEVFKSRYSPVKSFLYILRKA